MTVGDLYITATVDVPATVVSVPSGGRAQIGTQAGQAQAAPAPGDTISPNTSHSGTSAPRPNGGSAV